MIVTRAARALMAAVRAMQAGENVEWTPANYRMTDSVTGTRPITAGGVKTTLPNGRELSIVPYNEGGHFALSVELVLGYEPGRPVRPGSDDTRGRGTPHTANSIFMGPRAERIWQLIETSMAQPQALPPGRNLA
jgi:hypothetical protein